MGAIAAVVVASSCAGDNAAKPATSAPPAASARTVPVDTTEQADLQLPAGVDVFVEFPRYLQLQRRLEVAVDNTGDDPVVITEVALRSPLFQDVAAEEGSTEVEAGRRRDLQIGLGLPVCPAPAGASFVEIAATVEGRAQRGRVEVDPAPLQRISDDECGQAYVEERVALGYSADYAMADGVVNAALTVQRRSGDEPVAITSVRGSVLIELVPVDAGAQPLGELTAGAETSSVPVRMRVIRCDPHAVIESKKTFQLATWVSVGDRQPQRMVVAPTGQLRMALEGLIDECLRAQSEQSASEGE